MSSNVGWILREMVQMSRVMEDCSRSWCWKLEKPICQWWRGWTAGKQIGWRKPLESLPGWHVKWHGWSMTTDKLVCSLCCRSKLRMSLGPSWTGCTPERKASGGWWARQWCAWSILYRLKTDAEWKRVITQPHNTVSKCVTIHKPLVFTVRCYAERGYATLCRLSVRLSIYL